MHRANPDPEGTLWDGERRGLGPDWAVLGLTGRRQKYPCVEDQQLEPGSHHHQTVYRGIHKAILFWSYTDYLIIILVDLNKRVVVVETLLGSIKNSRTPTTSFLLSPNIIRTEYWKLLLRGLTLGLVSKLRF